MELEPACWGGSPSQPPARSIQPVPPTAREPLHSCVLARSLALYEIVKVGLERQFQRRCRLVKGFRKLTLCLLVESETTPSYWRCSTKPQHYNRYGAAPPTFFRVVVFLGFWIGHLITSLSFHLIFILFTIRFSILFLNINLLFFLIHKSLSCTPRIKKYRT